MGYQVKLKASMKLKKEDFQGEGANDYKFGFRMPLKCLNSTHCEWICKNMIQHDGISNKTIESEQNTKIEDLENDDDQQFETDLVTVDDAENEDLPEEDTTKEQKAPVVPKRILAETTGDFGLVYDVDGYVADDDAFEAGVVVNEAAMGES